MDLPHSEMDRLYAEPSVAAYRPEAALAEHTDGSRIAALCFSLPPSEEQVIRSGIGIFVVGWLCAVVPWAFAQPAPAHWSSIEKITRGSCGEGAIADVIESAGRLSIRIVIDGRQVAHFDVPLAPDGSGTAEFPGATGRNVMVIPAGTGRRPMRIARLDGACEWSWSPR